MLLANTDKSGEQERRYVSLFTGHRVHGLVIAPTGNSEESRHFLQRQKTPLVLSEQKPPGD